MDQLLRKDPKNPEVRLRAWGVDRLLSGDIITEQNIHALDVACWMLDAEPLRAYGTGGRKREFLRQLLGPLRRHLLLTRTTWW